MRFKIETLEYYFAKYLINKGIKSVVQIPLSPQQKTRNVSFGFFYFFPFQKFTFESEEEIKKLTKIFLVWFFVVGTHLWDHGIIPSAF